MSIYSSGCGEANKIQVAFRLDEDTNTEYSKNTMHIFEESASEMYPSFFGASFKKCYPGSGENGRPEKMIFTSDRDGQFDIYELDIPENIGIPDF